MIKEAFVTLPRYTTEDACAKFQIMIKAVSDSGGSSLSELSFDIYNLHDHSLFFQ